MRKSHLLWLGLLAALSFLCRQDEIRMRILFAGLFFTGNVKQLKTNNWFRIELTIPSVSLVY